MAVRRLAAEQPESFEFTEKNLAWAKKLIDRYPAGRQASAVIPLLWRAQEQNDGWVSEPAVRYIAELLDMPNIRVLEVATFYTMFQLQPVGKKAHIQVCGTTPCQLRGSEDLIKICKSRIAKHMHEISEDGMFSWEEVECLGACVNAPMVQIFKDTYEDLTEDSFNKLIDDIAAGKEVTPGPQNGRRFAMAEGGQTSLTEIDDDTKGTLPLPHVVDGSEKASHHFAGAAINTGGNDYDGVPTPAEDAVAKVVAAHAAKSAKKDEAPAPAPTPKKAAAKTADKVEKAAKKADEPKPVSKAKPKAAPAETAEVAEKEPALLKKARGGKPDDLKKLKGVGPKLEATLNQLGFFHFDQVAAWGAEEIAWVDSRLKFKGRIERDGWIDQAKILASGEDTEFSKRVEAGEVASSKSED
ncbi:NADH-quinone oxidoreductase subunit E [Roseibium sediminicola]|uniref:NADH-quinone oxidoreductase subunit E n=1 Tax=Roseibium sediminicola TaxID=2933272 RepID=A0ABT0GP49_9HYPH|nr:NADH-quinone oxidoreductase subunit E [Roseibium sp. CAU 1639]MCK7611221.1 NADH-quinone oxidoreductase subunit E [Roseibium sp. CAU 1639]